MVPEKIDSISINTIRGEGVEALIEWFEQHKQFFCLLGWSYLQNKQQMEELFYQSIMNVHKELPRYKGETSFEMWVTSLFIHTCRELSDGRSLVDSRNSEPAQEVLLALDQLEESDRVAVVLTYVKRFSKEEAAHLLQVSEEKMKELLFSGIQSLRNEMGYGSSFNGCKERHKDYIDYLERNMDRARKIDFEIHIYHCQNCQEDLGTFQEVMLTMRDLNDRLEEFQIPSGFMENIKARFVKREKQRQQKRKKRKRIGQVFAGVFALLVGIGFVTGLFTNLYYSWTVEDQQLRAFLQQDLGEKLNLEAESEGVKIKIKSAIADDVQTLVFYEIEDTAEGNQYMIDFHDGVFVENAHEILSRDRYPRFYPPDLESEVNNEEKNVYHGKISLPPLTADNGTIQLNITRLQRLIYDSSDGNRYRANENFESETGEWYFEIPVTKHPSVEYVLDAETEVEGIPVRFEKLTMAPTSTILEYGINHEQAEKRIDILNFDHLEVNNKKVIADLYGSNYVDSHHDRNWVAYQIHFDPVYGEIPKQVDVQFESVYLTVEDHKTIELDASKEYPQTFEYAGSTISIDKVEVGESAEVVISNHDIENRAYESLQFHIFNEDEVEPYSTMMDSEGVLMDKNGTVYDLNETPISYDEIEQPRHFFTVHTMRLDNNNPLEQVIPKRLEIYGYNTTKYLDDVVKISLE